MIHGDAYDGKSQCNVYTGHRVPFSGLLIVYKSYQFQGNMPLVVVHGHHDVVPAPPGFGEYGVRRHRAVRVNSLRPGRLDGGGDLLDFLQAEESELAAVGV